MLRDEIAEMKKHTPELLTTRGGGCRYCGQIVTMEVPIDWDDDTLDEAATEQCDCTRAGIYTRQKQQKEKARKAIEDEFGEKGSGIDEEVKILLIDLSEKVVETKINSGTIDIGEGIKAKIGINGKGFVKVEQIKTKKTKREV